MKVSNSSLEIVIRQKKVAYAEVKVKQYVFARCRGAN
jgi:hypothetical protein